MSEWEEGGRPGGEEELQEGGCLIKQFRYGARRNMRSYPPSLNARFLVRLPVLSTPKKKRKRSEGASEKKRYNISTRMFYEISQFLRKLSNRNLESCVET